MVSQYWSLSLVSACMRCCNFVAAEKTQSNLCLTDSNRRIFVVVLYVFEDASDVNDTY
jgi:hypothetical protein